MTTQTRKPTCITTYWDTQDRDNEGWAYRLSDDQGDIDSGGLDASDIDAAIGEAIRISGLDLTSDQFAREPNLEGGFAIWTA